MMGAISSTMDNEEQRNELEMFYKEYMNCFFNIAYLYLHSKSDAEDAVQEAFRDIVSNPDKFFAVAPENRTRFMVAVIRNISADMFNKKNKIPFEELNEEEPYDGNPFSFEDNIIGNIAKDELKHFIKKLPNLQRDVLTLRYLLGFSTAETAEKLNISQSAVKKRLHLAKEAVREFVRKGDGLNE